jgi:hypothetical protein
VSPSGQKRKCWRFEAMSALPLRSRHQSRFQLRQLCATSGLVRRNKLPALFNHFVGAGEHERGTATPTALAVLRLMINSKIVGFSNGRSAGCVPLRILSGGSATADFRSGSFATGSSQQQVRPCPLSRIYLPGYTMLPAHVPSIIVLAIASPSGDLASASRREGCSFSWTAGAALRPQQQALLAVTASIRMTKVIEQHP